ncbi:MAG TPA: RHS repeat-associated core domain-containing protein, partial [Blastocatellia bacterium]|nr:RHS repeat-associated core domain-containing protein [Blastocatellia bacterium]
MLRQGGAGLRAGQERADADVTHRVVTGGAVTTEVFGYDSSRLQLTSQTAMRGSTTLMSLTYNYQATAGQNGVGTTAGNSGQLMSISGLINGTTESASYTYDLSNRLTTSSQTTNGVNAQRRFVYDRWGNRTGVWDATTGGNLIQSVVLQQSGGVPTNRLNSVTTNSVQATYTYDAAGNVINDGTHSYVYDAENRLVSTDGGAVLCSYDHQNRRVKKTTASGTRHYVWEGSQVLAEYNGTTGAELLNYIYAGRMIAKSEGGVLRYFLSDRLSSRVVLDVNGSAVGVESQLPFGEALAPSGEQEKHTFTRYERESETGMDYALNRGYSSTGARFQSPDPYRASGYMVDPRSWNRYSYTRNDPVNRIDPLGLEDLPEGWSYQCT